MNDEIIKKVARLTKSCEFGIKRDVLVEELAELMEVNNRQQLSLNKWTNDKVLEEFSDAYLMVSQVCVYFGEESLEAYVDNYDNAGAMFESDREMSFIQKATHLIWTVSKMRREPDIIKNYNEFRASVYLIAKLFDDNMSNLRCLKATEVLNKIEQIMIFKLDRQIKRQEGIMLNALTPEEEAAIEKWKENLAKTIDAGKDAKENVLLNNLRNAINYTPEDIEDIKSRLPKSREDFLNHNCEEVNNGSDSTETSN